MESKLTRKYGLVTAVCMVVGTVIGSGIFFRNEAVLAAIGGNMWIGVAAWLIGGVITLAGAYVFAKLATKYEKMGGLVDYSETLVGKPYGYLMGWFLASIMYPSLAGILAWVSARFTVILFAWDADPSFSGQTYAIALFYLIAIYSINMLSPKLSGKFQVSTTFIKVIPLIFMGIIGTIAGLVNGTTVANLNTTYVAAPDGNPFLIALVATAFAYLGWDAVLSLNSDIKNSKRNLPIALVGGMIIVITIYVLYFVGIFSAAPVEELAGGEGVRGAFVNIFGNVAGTGLFVFIVISCIGTLNGLIAGGSRAFYALAVRKDGFDPERFSQVDQATDVPNNSGVLNLMCIAAWMLAYAGNFAGWYGDFFFDVPGLVPITLFGSFIPVYLYVIFKEKEFSFFNRFVAPTVAAAGASFLVFGVVYNQGTAVLWYLGIFIGIMVLGWTRYRGGKSS